MKVDGTPHDLVVATIRKHTIEAALAVARLESQQRCVPATQRSNNAMLHLTKKIKEAQLVLDAWIKVEKAARS
jgi:hypothetical protein